MRRRLRTPAAVCLLLGLASAGAHGASALDGLFEDAVLARGKGVEVRRSQLDEAFIAYKANLAGRGQVIPEDERQARETLLLDRLIVTQILTNRATADDKTKARELAQKLFRDAQKEFPTEEAFRRQLMVLGLSGERYTNQVLEQALAQAVVDRELRSKVVVSEVQIEEFYAAGTDVLVQALQAELERAAKDPRSTADLLAELKRQIERLRKDNLSRLEQSERVRVAHVLLATRDRETEQPLSDDQKKVKRHQIEKIRTAALAGEDFGKLVQEFSEDRNLSQTKGEYVLTREAPFVPEFKAAAFSLQPGQISDIVTTAFGYHILKVLERIPARKVELGTVKDELRTLLTEQHVQKQMPAYFRTLKKEADVQVLDPKYRIDVSKDVNPLKNE